MYISGIDFPNDIIDAVNEGNLVVFAGAGVSMGAPTLLPNFENLTKQIAIGTGQSCKTSECDAFLGRLKHQNINVNEIAAEKLSQMDLQHNKLHEYIIELFPDITKIKIVTTNYDNMFEQALEQMNMTNVKVYDAPALPLGNDIKGIVHIHGNVNEPEYMVLTDEDFGKAYLSDGYVARFLVKLFETYTVLFIGYSYNDTIVRYLTRAMTKDQMHKRFVLTDSEGGGWTELGIQPIVFEAGGFDILNEGVHKLGERIKRGLLDWKNSLSVIAPKPPVDLATISEMDFCLQDVNKVRILIGCIKGEEWLWWLEKKGVLKNLFIPDVQFSELDALWLNWLVDNYVGKEDRLIKRILAKHNSCMNLKLASCILQKIAYDDGLFNDTVLKEYLVILDEYLSDVWTISRINEIVMKRNLYSLGWRLFTKLFEFKMVLQEGKFSRDKEEICIQHNILGDGYLVNSVWLDYREIYIEHYPLEILKFAMDYVMKLHFNYAQFGMASKEGEPYALLQSVSFDANRTFYFYHDAIPVLERVIVETCIGIQETQKNIVRNFIEQCVKSESTLLRVIGVRLLKETNTFSNDEKAELLVQNICIYSLWEKERVFKLVADIFDEISNENQHKILSEIEKGKDYNDEKTSAYAKYNWAVWLQKKCKPNERVRKIIEDVKSDYPTFQPRKNPELSLRSSKAVWGGTTSPISQEEMKIMEISQLMEMLQTYSGDKWEGPDREGLLNTFANCIKEDFSWACRMLEVLKKEFQYDLDVWAYFFRGLEKSNLNADEYIDILRKLQIDDLISSRNLDMSRLLENAIDSDCIKESFFIYGEELYEIAIRLWKKRGKEDKFKEGMLIDMCCNCATGILTLIWIKMLSYEDDNGIPPKYQELFEKILAEEENEQVICVLVGQMAFLFARDRKWCISNLFPILNSKSKKEFKAAWEGIAWFSRRLYKELADEVIPVYLQAVDRLDDLEREAREGFVELYTVLMIYAVDNPIIEFIPKLFKVAKEVDRKQFIDSVWGTLCNMNSEQKYHLWNAWLKEYWWNRVKNIPVPLQEYENAAMLEWIFELNELYPEAIEIIVSGTSINSMPPTFWYKLHEGEWSRKYPDATAKLLVFLLNSNVDFGYRYKEVKEIANMISYADEKNQHALNEALLRRGLG
ncbi:MAG: DUF4020 domain-containing protein [Lachnospiraceae bacterium]|nr:DUF4020 domain-containing protein [Lachnospiraceae bacterium]